MKSHKSQHFFEFDDDSQVNQTNKMMSARSFFAKCLLLAMVISSTSGFVAKPLVSVSNHAQTAFVSSERMITAMQLKLDPNELEKNASNNNAGNLKGAAYGGSIAVAALLPVAFLVWAAVH